MWATEAFHRQEDSRKDMEINGQSSEIVPAAENEFKEQPTLYIGHSAGYVSEATFDILQERRSNAHSSQQ